MNNTTVILQARMSSTRLPGKVLKLILGKPMLLHQVERIQRSKLIRQIIVATSIEASDDPIEEMCMSNNISLFRGSLNDVLDRYYKCAIHYSLFDNIIRLTGDCPLTDSELLDEIINFFSLRNYDYASNTIKRTFPHGLDMEIFKFSCLKDAWVEGKTPYQREHVTPFMHQNNDRYRLGSFEQLKYLGNLRWTVDEELDFVLVEKIYNALYHIKPGFKMNDILQLIEVNPSLATLNIKK